MQCLINDNCPGISFGLLGKFSHSHSFSTVVAGQLRKRGICHSRINILSHRYEFSKDVDHDGSARERQCNDLCVCLRLCFDNFVMH